MNYYDEYWIEERLKEQAEYDSTNFLAHNLEVATRPVKFEVSKKVKCNTQNRSKKRVLPLQFSGRPFREDSNLLWQSKLHTLEIFNAMNLAQNGSDLFSFSGDKITLNYSPRTITLPQSPPTKILKTDVFFPSESSTSNRVVTPDASRSNTTPSTYPNF